jgi:hypothetical protein
MPEGPGLALANMNSKPSIFVAKIFTSLFSENPFLAKVFPKAIL